MNIFGAVCNRNGYSVTLAVIFKNSRNRAVVACNVKRVILSVIPDPVHGVSYVKVIFRIQKNSWNSLLYSGKQPFRRY